MPFGTLSQAEKCGYRTRENERKPPRAKNGDVHRPTGPEKRNDWLNNHAGQASEKLFGSPIRTSTGQGFGSEVTARVNRGSTWYGR